VGRFNANGKDAGDATRPAESPHNPQFRSVRRAKISPFGKQGASHGLILTPLGMTPRVHDATVRLLVVGCAAPVPRVRRENQHVFPLREKLLLNPRDYFSTSLFT